MQLVQPIVQQQAPLDGRDLLAGALAVAELSSGGPDKLDGVAIAICQDSFVIRERDHVCHRWSRHVPQPAQLVGDDLTLQLGLALVGDVLPLAASARLGPRPEIGAGRNHPVRAGMQDVEQTGTRPAILLLDDFDTHALTGDGVRHEDSLAAVPADRFPTVRDRVKG